MSHNITPNLTESWVVEWSPIQEVIHVDKLGRSLESSLKHCIQKKSNDYRIVAIADSCDEANEIAEKIKAMHGENQSSETTD